MPLRVIKRVGIKLFHQDTNIYLDQMQTHLLLVESRELTVDVEHTDLLAEEKLDFSGER